MNGVMMVLTLALKWVAARAVARRGGGYTCTSSAVRSPTGSLGETTNDRKNPCIQTVSPEHRQALRFHTESLPTGTAIPITREHLLSLLDSEPSSSTPALAPADRMLTAEDVAERLAVDVQTVRRRQRELGAVRIGRSIRFPERGIDRFVSRRALNRQGIS
jgi:excisionase family DNA binding protein